MSSHSRYFDLGVNVVFIIIWEIFMLLITLFLVKNISSGKELGDYVKSVIVNGTSTRYTATLSFVFVQTLSIVEDALNFCRVSLYCQESIKWIQIISKS